MWWMLAGAWVVRNVTCMLQVIVFDSVVNVHCTAVSAS
jgi:hypothetical protein